jgi:NADPH:quinone reductase-like Zn-dependent oxidoreductase
MKVFRFHQFGTIGCLGVSQESEPKPGVEQVLVRIRAAALNFRDLLVAWNQYPGSDLGASVAGLLAG